MPTYHYLDDGYPPKVNASKPPGEWQTLEVVFRRPSVQRRRQEGRERANLDKVVLNGQVVQEGVDLASPTGHNWRRTEVPSAPLLLQADHGPVAFRGIRVRHLP